MTYENGLFVSFLLYCYYVLNLIIILNSLGERNLNKVGERHSWLTLKPKPMDASDFDRPLLKKVGKFLFVITWQGLFVFLSWLNVLINLGYLIHSYYKDSGAPQAVKDFRWKLRNIDMTFDEIVLELIKVKDFQPEDFDDLKAELLEFVAQRRLK